MTRPGDRAEPILCDAPSGSGALAATAPRPRDRAGAGDGARSGRAARRPAVLVFAGLDPSGGAGIAADIEAIAANGAHALPVVTALTVQDHNRVHEVQAVEAALIERQAMALLAVTEISAIKLGIPGNAANADAIARVIAHARARRPDLPVILDPVLASGAGDSLTQPGSAVAHSPPVDTSPRVDSIVGPRPTDTSPGVATLAGWPRAVLADSGAGGAAGPGPARGLAMGSREYATKWLHIMLPLATVATPNLLEFEAADYSGVPHVLLTGGHAPGGAVLNRWRHADGTRTWSWARLPGEFHGSGCTLAASLAAHLARGLPMEEALHAAQTYTHRTLAKAYSIGAGQLIPCRIASGADLARAPTAGTAHASLSGTAHATSASTANADSASTAHATSAGAVRGAPASLPRCGEGPLAEPSTTSN